MENNHFQTIIKKHKLNTNELIDPTIAKKLKKIAKIEFIVFGSITVFSQHLNLTIKVLNTETGMLNASVSGDIPMDENIRELNRITNSNLNNGIPGKLIKPIEKYPIVEILDKECETKNMGNIIFKIVQIYLYWCSFQT
ncbi:MAG: hypothetical protein IPL42_09495 [Saprospiraceae bacterium]|nr:hypothetical protein [Saprospiraceae bacterium]